MKRILLFFHIIFIGISLGESQVSFQTISHKSEAALNEYVFVEFVLSVKNKNVNDLHDVGISLPTFPNAKVVGRQRFSENLRVENEELHVTYYQIALKAVKEGKLKIGPASAVVEGKTYHTHPITINITDNEQKIEKIDPTGMGDAFLMLKISNATPYQNEGVIGRLKFYTRRVELLNSRAHLALPNFQNLYIKGVDDDYARDSDYEQEVVNGEIYVSKIIKSYVIFPSKSGSVVIPPFTLSLIVPDGFFDEQKIHIQSAPVTLQVKKIPENAPGDFYGLVGDYTMKAVVNKKELKSAQAATLYIEIAGKGNIDLVKIPPLVISESIEQYTPKSKFESMANMEGLWGKVSTSTVLIPQEGGQYKIKIKPVSFFSPEEEIFKQLTMEPVILNVSDSDVPPVIDSSQYQMVPDSDKIISPVLDIKLEDEGPGNEKRSKGLLILTLSGIGILTLVIIYFGFIRKKEKPLQENTDKNTISDFAEKSKFEKLQSLPENRKKDFSPELFQLKKIAERGEDKKNFYSLLESTLQEAINQSLDISQSQFITPIEVEEKLANKFGDIFADECKNLLLRSQIEQYSSLSDKESLMSVYLKAEEIITKLV